MRIAIFTETYYPFISGVVTHIETLKKTLEEHGHEVMIVTTNPKAICHYVKDGVLYCPAIPLKRIYGYGISNPLNLQRLRILKEFNPDVLHVHTEFSMGIFAQFVAKKLKRPIVYTLHTMYDDYLFYLAPHKLGQKMVRPAAHMYIRSVANKATEIIGPSTKVVEFLQRCGVSRYINIVPNIVDVSDFLPANVKQEDIDRVKSKLGIQPGDTCLCFVGRLGQEKSLDVLIDWFADGFKGKETYKLFIIGDGPERAALQSQIQKRGMKKQISLLGKIDHNLLPPYYHACDLFATASLSEINSISMLEAMASGLYVLQRLDLYNRGQIISGENGEVFETAKEFHKLVEEQGRMTPEEKAARRNKVSTVSQNYGKKEFYDSVISVYKRAIKSYSAQLK